MRTCSCPKPIRVVVGPYGGPTHVACVTCGLPMGPRVEPRDPEAPWSEE